MKNRLAPFEIAPAQRRPATDAAWLEGEVVDEGGDAADRRQSESIAEMFDGMTRVADQILEAHVMTALARLVFALVVLKRRWIHAAAATGSTGPKGLSTTDMT